VGSFKPVRSFIAWLNTTSGFQSLYSTASGWKNSELTTFSTTVNGNNNYKAESNNFVFQISGLSQTQQSIVISIDTSFGALNSTPNGASLINSYKVKFPCTGGSCTLSLNLLNPINFANYTFQLDTYDDEDYAVGRGISNIWNLDCVDTNCRSCNSNKKCLDCYNQSITPYYIYDTLNLDCIRTCPAGYFLLNNITCSRCDSNCT